MNSALRNVSFLVLLVFTASGAMLAQGSTAAIAGQVTDETGALVPGVEIFVENLEMGFTRTLVTDFEGRYRASQLRLGEYRVEAALPGFKTGIRSGINLTQGRVAIVDFTLQVGQISEQLMVTGEAPLVDTVSSTLGEVVSGKMIQDLPLNGRDLAQLALLQPNVMHIRNKDTGSTRGRGTHLSVSGQRSNQNLFILDGTDINDALNATPGSAAGNMTGAESIREFKVLTNSYSAEYGRGATGGIMEAVSKSGSNQLRGSLFWFLRNDNLDAARWEDNAFGDAGKPEFKRNQFGASMGGPIAQDQTFFFSSYEGLRERLGINTNAEIPSAAQVAAAPIGLARDTLNLFPTPNFTEVNKKGDTIHRFILGQSQPTDEDYAMVRIDHIVSEQHSLYGRYTFTHSDRFIPSALPGVAATEIEKSRMQYVTLAWSAVPSPTMVNEARIGFNRSFVGDTNEVLDIPELVFIPGETAGALGIDPFDDLGFDEDKTFILNSYQFGDDLSLNRGAHSMKMGVSIRHSQYNGNSQRSNAGSYSFNDIDDFYLLQPETLQGLLPPSDTTRSFRQTLYGFYFQDDFKLRPNLTLNLGLRYEFGTIPSEKFGRESNLQGDFLLATVKDAGEECLAGEACMFPGPIFNSNTTLNEWAPRVGFAWDPFSDGRTAIRAGFGIFYETKLFYSYRNGAFRNPPFLQNFELEFEDRRDAGIPSNYPNDFSDAASAGCDQCDRLRPFETDPNSTYVQQWNLSLQHQLGQSTVFRVGYVGSRGVHLPNQADINNATPASEINGVKFFTGDIADGDRDRRNDDFSRVRQTTWENNSYYHGLVLGFNRQFAQGLRAQVSYTWSKTIDLGSDENGTAFTGGAEFYVDPYDRQRDKAVADYHLPNVFTFNINYDLPYGVGADALSKILGGWQLSTITSLTSGAPIHPVLEEDFDWDRDKSKDNTNRPDFNPDFTGDPILGQPDKWFNDDVFILPPGPNGDGGVYGNVGRNVLVGPGLAAFDFSMIKTIPLAEGKELQFRAEFFNIINHPNFGPPEERVWREAAEDAAEELEEELQENFDPDFPGSGDPSFRLTTQQAYDVTNDDRNRSIGKIEDTVTNARQIQFGLRLNF